MAQDFLHIVRAAAEQKLLFLAHAVNQMNRPDRMIAPTEVRGVLANGVIIEEYPEDTRGHSCLILGFGEENRPIHVVCSPKDKYLAIITVYIPDSDRWENDWQKRKPK